MKKPEAAISPVFLFLSAVFVCCLLVSNLIAGKIADVFGITVPAAVILFPLTYILGDLFTEVYGFKRFRLVVWCGFFCNLVAVSAYMIAVALPYPGYWTSQEAYAIVLQTTPRILAASLLGYLLGEFFNAVTLSKLKVKTNGKRFWLRAVVSSLLGEGLDTVVFITISFYGIYSNQQLITMLLFQYLWKICYEIALTPVTYLAVRHIKRIEGIDVFDVDEKYFPFSVKQ
jgi:uncharacterized integral membrane protein (TIGR00697 family)